MNADNGAMPPMLMFRSFLTIASGLVVHWLMVSVVTLVVARGWFPEYIDRLQQAGEALPPGAAFGQMPAAMFWAVIAIVTVLSFGLGLFVAWSAPFGRLVHAIFLSVIVGVNFLSRSVEAPQEQKVVMMSYLIFFSVAIFVGGYLGNRWLAIDRTNSESGLLQP